MLTVKNKGNFNNTNRFFNKANSIIYYPKIVDIANETLVELKSASPTLEIAEGWTFTIIPVKKTFTISFNNTVNDFSNNIVLIINEGHATRSGKWIPGLKFIDQPLENCARKLKNLINGGQ